MGIDQSVLFQGEAIPQWEAVCSLLEENGMTLQMRMINGELAFPEESPPEEWSEIRVGSPAGMVTIRREGSKLTFVIWGDSEPEMVRDWNLITWAYANLGNVMVQTGTGAVTAEDFYEQKLKQDS